MLPNQMIYEALVTALDSIFHGGPYAKSMAAMIHQSLAGAIQAMSLSTG